MHSKHTTTLVTEARLLISHPQTPAMTSMSGLMMNLKNTSVLSGWGHLGLYRYLHVWGDLVEVDTAVSLHVVLGVDGQVFVGVN